MRLQYTVQSNVVERESLEARIGESLSKMDEVTIQFREYKEDFNAAKMDLLWSQNTRLGKLCC